MKKSLYYFGVTFLIGGVLFAINNDIFEKEYVNVQNTALTTSSEKTAAFDTMMKVLSHERCVNCHPSDNMPKQGDESHPHYFDMKRGSNDSGFAATKCATCHQKENNDYAGVPGAPHWSLAPESMAWEGLNKTEIAAAMLDRSKNGNRSHEDLIHHLTKDDLVLWAFNPGVDNEGIPRSKPSVSEEEYKIAVKQWFAMGAIIPEVE